jgi:hypothetical protein
MSHESWDLVVTFPVVTASKFSICFLTTTESMLLCCNVNVYLLVLYVVKSEWLDISKIHRQTGHLFVSLSLLSFILIFFQCYSRKFFKNVCFVLESPMNLTKSLCFYYNLSLVLDTNQSVNIIISELINVNE